MESVSFNKCTFQRSIFESHLVILMFSEVQGVHLVSCYQREWGSIAQDLRWCHDALSCSVIFPFFTFCSLSLSSLELSAGQIGSITGALTFTIPVVNQWRSPALYMLLPMPNTSSSINSNWLNNSLQYYRPLIHSSMSLFLAAAHLKEFCAIPLNTIAPAAASPSSCRC